jgi:hypothetical protein
LLLAVHVAATYIIAIAIVIPVSIELESNIQADTHTHFSPHYNDFFAWDHQ